MAFVTSNMEGVDFTQVFTPPSSTGDSLAYPRPPFAVGTKASGSDGTEYVYATCASTLAAGDVVQLTPAWVAAGISTSNDLTGNLVGVMPAAAVSGQFFWVQRAGVCSAINVLASCAANVAINTTATAGYLDDDATTAAKIVEGIVLTTARAANNGPAPGILNYPAVGNSIP